MIEQVILKKVADLHRYHCSPVRTIIVADCVGKCDRTIRFYLVRLEQRGLVERVGRRGGWLPVRGWVQ